MNDALQASAAIATIFAAPWFVKLVKFAFRSRYDVQYKSLEKKNFHQAEDWLVEICNRSDTVTGDDLYLRSAESGVEITMYGASNLNHSALQIGIVRSGKIIVLNLKYFPRKERYLIYLRFNRPSVPVVDSKIHHVNDKVKFPYNFVSPYLSLEIARFRLLNVVLGFFVLVMIIFARIIYVGFT